MTSEGFMDTKISITTDKGTTKEVNQDSTMVKVASTAQYGKIVMGVLCDGMGGLTQGEVASAKAIELMGKWFVEGLPMALYHKNVTERLDRTETLDIISEITRGWQTLALDINAEILDYGNQHRCMLGTTMVALLVIGGEYVIMNIGDSRVYGSDRGQAVLLTHDQSVVQDMIDKGMMTEQEAENSPQKSVLLQCLGVSEDVKPQMVRGKIERGQEFVLCSDGFWRGLTQDELNSCLSHPSTATEDDMKKNLDRLVETLKNRGEKDNISVINICIE